MKENATMQEIILFTGTSFSGRQCKAKQGYRNHWVVNEAAQLEKICRSGLLQQMLPEICEISSAGEQLIVRNIRKTSTFVEIELGDPSARADGILSLDPEIFLSPKSFN
jgi:hypothetical protein